MKIWSTDFLVRRQVFKTMSRIRRVLVDRYHSWQEAMTILNRTSVKDLPLDEEESVRQIQKTAIFGYLNG